MIKLLRINFILLLLLSTSSLVRAQDRQQVENQQSNWYVGLRAGVPFGVSTFTSFGADKSRGETKKQ